VEALGGPGEVALLGRGHEMRQLPQLHNSSPSVLNLVTNLYWTDGTTGGSFTRTLQTAIDTGLARLKAEAERQATR
jgi:hypothetical protein